LKRQAEAAGWFDGVRCFTADAAEPWLREFLASTAEFRHSNPRGYGLWYWKPFLVQKMLAEIEADAHLYYVDAGCEISALGAGRFKEFDRRLRDQGTLFFTLPFMEVDWTSPSLIARFAGTHIGLTPQVQATWFGLRNTANVRSLVEGWWRESAANDFEALRGADGTGDATARSFEHRHDQSVLSCLVKTTQPPIPTLPWEDFYAPWLYCRDSWALLEPVHALRRAGPDSVVDDLVRRSNAEACWNNLRSPGRAFRVRSGARRWSRVLRDEITFLRGRVSRTR
jgi:hypothetical protein